MGTFPKLTDYKTEDVSKAFQALLDGADLVRGGSTVVLVNTTGLVFVDFGQF